MTKLFEWLSGLLFYLGIWLILVTRKIDINISHKWDGLILFLPLYTLVLFGIYSFIVVLWRVYSFNDCPEAAIELQQQIKAAKEELKIKGFKM